MKYQQYFESENISGAFSEVLTARAVCFVARKLAGRAIIQWPSKEQKISHHLKCFFLFFMLCNALQNCEKLLFARQVVMGWADGR